MNQSIPELESYNEADLERAFAALQDEVRREANELDSVDAVEQFHIRWLGRKQGRLNLIGEAWRKMAPTGSMKALGIRFNELKQLLISQIEIAKAKAILGPIAAGLPRTDRAKLVAVAKSRAGMVPLDITLPGSVRTPGVEHPLLRTMQEIVQVFHHLGYSTALGPQVESDFYNFEALNFPPNHPARDTQDTLVLAGQQAKPSRDRLLMRTHTSPVQIRTMIANPPPIRIVVPGKVHRNDAADATHSPVFHQVEGLCVDTNITFSDLKGTLDHAMKELFGSDVKTRFFPSFFPFTEPSADVQISCIFCAGKGCRKCKHSGWIELLGCGMVDPAVFASVDEQRAVQGHAPAYDPAQVSGFAFGMGVERIAMIQHGISDIGQFYSGDMRFLEQFA
jgi:phenylalanyl-tRNA synthetase alpha chain